MTTIVVCGGRDLTDKGLVWRALDAIRAELGVTRIAHGACGVDSHGPWTSDLLRGADKLADQWAAERGLISRWYPVPWKSCEGDPARWSSAARARASRMLAAEQPVAVIAFPGGKGTGMTMRLAQVVGIKVRYVPAVGL